MATKTLRATLKVTDSFSSTLNKFANALNKTENSFKTFATRIEQSSNKLGVALNKVTTRANAMSRSFVTAQTRMSNSVNQTTSKIVNQTNQVDKQMNNIVSKSKQLGNSLETSMNKFNNTVRTSSSTIKQMGQAIDNVKEKGTLAAKVSNWNIIEVMGNMKSLVGVTNKLKSIGPIRIKSTNTNSTNNNGNNGQWSGIENILRNVIGGNFAGIIGKLGILGVGVMGITKLFEFSNTIMNTGFDILNSSLDNMLTMDGMKNTIEESMAFQTGRESLNLFYGSEQEGLKKYQIATEVARETFASEKDTVDIMSKMGMLGVSVNKDQLKSFIDVAGTRPTVGTEHIGLALKNAMEGNITMLKYYGINNGMLMDYLKQLKKTDKDKYKDYKGAFKDKKGKIGDRQDWINLFADYVQNGSPFNGYAEVFARNTLEGQLRRFGGIVDLLKGSITGINTDTGKAYEGGLFDSISKALTNFENTLKSTRVQDALNMVGKSLGKAFTEIAKVFNNILTPDMLNKIGKAFAKVGETLVKIIDRLEKSGKLDKLLESLPLMVEKVVNNKAIDATTNAKVAIDLANGDYLAAGMDKVSGWFDKAENFFGRTNMIDRNYEINGQRSTNAWKQRIYDEAHQDKNRAEMREVFVSSPTISNAATNSIMNQNTQNKNYYNNDNKVNNNITVNINEANKMNETSLVERIGNKIASTLMKGSHNS